MESSTSVLQSKNRVNKTIEENMRTTQKTMIPVYPHENAPVYDNIQDIFHI